MASQTLRRPRADAPWSPSLVIPLYDTVLGYRGAGIRLRGDDGVRLDQTGGATLSSGSYNLDVQSTVGKHAAFVLSATTPTVAPTTANSAVLIDDAGLFVGAGTALRVYETSGVDYAAMTSVDGLLTLGGSGAGAGQLSLTALTATSWIAIGATPATAGSLRLASASSVQARNNANGANISLLTTDASDNLFVGDGVNAAGVVVRALTHIYARIGSTDYLHLGTAGAFEALKIATPATTTTGYSGLYPKTDERWYRRSSAGAEKLLAEEGGMAVVLVDNTYASLHNGTAIAATTETDFTTNLTFTVASATSTIEIVTRGGGQCQLTPGGPGLVTSRMRLDSAGANTLYYWGGQRVMVATEFANPFTGACNVFITGLAVGAHTVKFTLYTEAAGKIYMRASATEQFNVTIIEHH